MRLLAKYMDKNRILMYSIIKQGGSRKVINKLSCVLVNFLLKMNSINSNQETLAYYKYGIEITISSLLNIIIRTPRKLTL